MVGSCTSRFLPFWTFRPGACLASAGDDAAPDAQSPSAELDQEPWGKAPGKKGSAVRPIISILTVITLLQSFGGATSIIVCEILNGIYKYPATKEVAAAISVFITVPLEVAFIVVAVWAGWIKLE